MKKSDKRIAEKLSKIFSDFANKMCEKSKDKTQDYIKYYSRAVAYFYINTNFKNLLNGK